MYWLTNARRQQQTQVSGLLARFTPSPSIGPLYRKSIERHFLQSAAASYSPYRLGVGKVEKRKNIKMEGEALWRIRPA